MKGSILVTICLFIALSLNGQKVPVQLAEEDFSIGKTIRIASKVLQEERILNVSLPLDYERDTSKFYPVIYLLDGSKDEDFIHIVGLVQFGSFSWIDFVPESIIVGIANIDRKRDFTSPSQNKLDQEEFPTSGHSEKFINFIKSEVQPFIESKYRTSSPKTIIGQSLGGLLATEILYKHPELFDNYIIVSPSLWWNQEKLLEYNSRKFSSPKSIYIAVGKEGEIMERTAKSLYEKLSSRKSPERNVFFEFMEDKTHGDALHLAVYNALEHFSFQKKR